MSASRSSDGDGNQAPTLIRHDAAARWLHGANALVVLILLVTGLALGDRLSDDFVEWIGGHEQINDVHQWLGLAYVAVAFALAVLLARRFLGLWRDALRFARGDARWMAAFARHYFRSRRHAAPFHDGRFDPAQRWMMAGLLAGLLLVALSGLVTVVFPDMGRVGYKWTLRTHIYGAWLLLVCVALHIVAGLGIPRTHRGLVRAMFGDGRVRLSLARTLWPGWTRRQQGRLHVSRHGRGGDR